jgi:hypothetical protein
MFKMADNKAAESENPSRTVVGTSQGWSDARMPLTIIFNILS